MRNRVDVNTKPKHKTDPAEQAPPVLPHLLILQRFYYYIHARKKQVHYLFFSGIICWRAMAALKGHMEYCIINILPLVFQTRAKRRWAGISADTSQSEVGIFQTTNFADFVVFFYKTSRVFWLYFVEGLMADSIIDMLSFRDPSPIIFRSSIADTHDSYLQRYTRGRLRPSPAQKID